MGKPTSGFVRKRGSKFYIYLKYAGQKQVARVTGARNVTEARHILTNYLIKDVDYLQRGNARLEEYATRWIERRKIDLKPSTYDRYKLSLNKHIIPYFQGMKVNSIYAGDVLDFRNQLAKKKGPSGRPLSPKTVNNVLLILSSLFSDALDDCMTQDNPVKIRKHRLHYDYPEADHFTVEEMKRFLEHVSATYYPFFLLLWNTGLRVSEAVALKWTDIDWGNDVINITRSIYRNKEGRVEVRPKSRAGKRFVLLTPQLSDVLGTYRSEKKIQSLDDYVFDRNGEPLNTDGIVRSEFRRTLRRAGLRTTLTPHSIRHGFVTVCRRNFAEWIVKRITGHYSLNGTRDITDVYTHLNDLGEYAVQLGRLLNECSLVNIKKPIIMPYKAKLNN